ncbi:MAG: hypothetical protein JXB07_19335 [Anaerolineae bacterium]|nr:hypothetical protein [Anaerolineae bacterium]
MTRHQRISLGMTLVSLALAALACSTPVVEPTPTVPSETPAPTATWTPAYSPTPDLPPGWVPYRSEIVQISLYRPSDWVVTSYDEPRIDLTEEQGRGWIEIAMLDETTMGQWGLDYQPGMDAEAIIDDLARAAREDGRFEAPRQIENRSGASAWAIAGHYEVLDDFVLIAVVGLDDKGFILVGHGGSDEAEWSRLRPIYEQVVWSVTP